MEETRPKYKYNYYQANKLKQTKLGILLIWFLITVISYIIYVLTPVYYKERLLKYQLKEQLRTGACNCHSYEKLLEKECRKIVNEIGFSTNSIIIVNVYSKNDNLVVKCCGIVPLNFLVLTYNYNINIELLASRDSY